MKTIELKCVTRLQDNGDGGYTGYFYNSEEELLADHPLARPWKENSEGKWGCWPVELNDKQKADILNEDDPYENGYIGQAIIKLNVDEQGNVLLAEPFSFSAGQ
jgi:hypothetical protein